MKKFFAIGLLVFSSLFGFLSAQDCDFIVLGHMYSMEAVRSLPVEKYNYYCNFSRNSLFEVDELPGDAVIFNISELEDSFTGQLLPQDYVVNLDSMSYWRFDFVKFQNRVDLHSPIFFSTPNSAHPYLGVRSTYEADLLTEQQQ